MTTKTDVHPRQAEILLNNYRTFMNRAIRTDDWQYKMDCIKAANEADLQYAEITGHRIDE